MLIRKGASTRAQDIDGRTPLHSALGRASRSSDCVKILLKASANVNQPDLFGYTPMHLAALNEFSSCVCLLLGKYLYSKIDIYIFLIYYIS